MTKHEASTLSLEVLADLAGALSEPKRLLALGMLSRGELCLCDLTEGLDLSPSTVSNHMAILKRAGLVEARKDGRWAHFRLADTNPSPAVSQVLRWALEHLPESAIPSAPCEEGGCCP